MALDTVTAIPMAGSLPADDLARAGKDDVLVAMTFKPFRREVVEAVEAARAQKMQIIAITDSPAAPILPGAAHRFIVPTPPRKIRASRTVPPPRPSSPAR